jgi:hypothetical protein
MLALVLLGIPDNTDNIDDTGIHAITTLLCQGAIAVQL